jgi:hypothetical protein
MYILLDLQVLDTLKSNKRPSDWTQPMPDNLSLLFWRILAGRYRSDPAVLYDLCNEPHKPESKDLPTYRGYRPPKDSGWPDLWHEWARQIEAVIHHVHWDAVIFISGIGGPCYAANLQSMPVPIPPFYVKNQRYIPNAVYSCHIYPAVKPEDWTKRLGIEKLRKKYPIFIGEFGAQPEDFDPRYTSTPTPSVESAEQLAINQKAIDAMLKWGGDLIIYLNALREKQNGVWQGLAGWTAWSWGDEPYLVERDMSGTKVGTKDGDRPYQMNPANPKVHSLTKFGELVKLKISEP